MHGHASARALDPVSPGQSPPILLEDGHCQIEAQNNFSCLVKFPASMAGAAEDWNLPGAGGGV